MKFSVKIFGSYHSSVVNFHVLHIIINFLCDFTTFFKDFTSSEDGGIVLHSLLELISKIILNCYPRKCLLSYLRVAVLMLPSAIRTLSMLEMDSSPAFGAISGNSSPGLHSSSIVLAQARPNTTKSKSELAPNLFAP